MKENFKNNIAIFLILFFFLCLLFISRIIYIVFTEQPYPISTKISNKELAIRGNIYSKDKFNIANSKKVYSLAIDTNFIKENKKELLINLLSIYTNTPKEYLKKQLSKTGRVIVLKKFSSKTAKNLRYLSTVLDIKKLFLAKKSGIRYGLEVYEEHFKRVYNYKDTLEPVLGFFNIKQSKGISGIENFYDEILKEKQNGVIKGYRDLNNRIIIDNNTKITPLKDGKNLHLNINLVLQRKIEFLLDKYKKELNATEIITSIMDSKSGKILVLASSNRYNPNHIKQSDIKYMKISAIQYIFEAGSVLKPITLAILLKNKKITSIYEVLNAHYGRWHPRWRKTAIIDEHISKWLTVENAIVYSSNIVTAQLALRLSAMQFYKGLTSFGFSKKSGIDISYEVKGDIPTIKQLQSNTYKSTTGYGYSLRVNFIQLLKAYNIFNNNGLVITPSIGDKFGNIKINNQPKRVISAKTALIIKNILRKVVLKGTGKATKIDGLFIAGKTGTAYITKDSEYIENYNSSFFGFANDNKHKYTIGVTVINPKYEKHYASQSAVPVFKEIVEILINNLYLTPKESK